MMDDDTEPAQEASTKEIDAVPGFASWHGLWRAWCFLCWQLVSPYTALVNTDGVHRYLLNMVQSKASEALGVRVQLQNFTLHLSTLSLDLYGIRVAGANPYPDPPLLQADHVGVEVRIVSVIHRAWYLDRLQIDHPVAWVVVDKDGRSNIPEIKSSGSSHTDVFQLGIRHALLIRGEIYYNDRPSALAADLHNLEFQVYFQ